MAGGKPPGREKATEQPVEPARSISGLLLAARKDWRASLLILAVTVAIVAAISIVVAYAFLAPSPKPQIALPYDVFKDELKNGNVASVSTIGSRITGVACTTVKEPGTRRQSALFSTVLPNFGDGELEALIESARCNGHRVAINPERVVFRWDYVLSATPLSTFAAVLAGFVIIAVATILSLPKEGSIPPYIPLQPLLTAFLTLVVAAFLFAVLAGLPAGGGDRLLPLAQGYAVSWILVFGILQTAVGISWLVKHFVVDVNQDAALRTARLVVHVSIVVLAVAIAGAVTQPLYVLYPDRAIEDGAAWAIVGIVPLVAIPVGIWFNRGRDHKLVRHLTTPALGLVILAFLGAGVLLGSTEDDVRNGYKVLFSLMVAAQVVLGGVFTLYEAALPFGGSRRRSPTGGVAAS